MREFENLIGNEYGDLKVEALAEPTLNGARRWLCRCKCGNTTVVLESNLKRLHTKSCGCHKSPDLTGKFFGRLEVLGRSDKRNPRGARTTPMWRCRCECGNITYKATDTLNYTKDCMCQECKGKIGAETARASAGFVGGTQITKLRNLEPTAANTSGCRGVYYDKRSNKYRARLKFKGKIMNFGSFSKFEDAVAARKEAEKEYFEAFLDSNREVNEGDL